MLTENKRFKTFNIEADILTKWQKIINILASIFDLPSALIMRLNEEKIEVFISSKTKNNPYNVGDCNVVFNSGLYCETVVNTQEMLFVKNALKDTHWKKNPDIKLNMINYLGLPISLVNGEPFGTICVLDKKEREYTQLQIDLLTEFRNIVEEDLKLINTYKHLLDSEKMAALGGLVAGVAHEVNTPIGLSLTGITNLKDRTKNINKLYIKDEMTQENFEDFLKVSIELNDSIYKNLIKAVELIQSFKSISVDQTSENIYQFNIKEKIQDVLCAFDNKLKNYNIKTFIECEDTLEINTCPSSIYQIFTNLILNSLTHAFEKNDKGEIVIKAYIKNGKTYLIYKDTGKGIDKEIIPKIFDPFFTTNRKGGNTGLGLHLIYNIVHSKLNGTISVKSKKDKGTSFEIIF